MIEQLSIDLSNYCTKGCPFCYNKSNKRGESAWTTKEVISFAEDCISHGIKTVSLGGGEPFEYDGIFDVIDALYPKCYLTVTTNGLLLDEKTIWDRLMKSSPDKIHITIHQPANESEVKRVVDQLKRLKETKIKPGLNLLVRSNEIAEAKSVFDRVLTILKLDQIILIPQRYAETPTPKELSIVANGHPFQSPSCILKCQRPTNFCSVTWDKRVNYCSYADDKEQLATLDYEGLINALSKIEWTKIKKCTD
jgi:MoaA/NifB/PqqE/SkfB family radical SAM enzyme